MGASAASHGEGLHAVEGGQGEDSESIASFEVFGGVGSIDCLWSLKGRKRGQSTPSETLQRNAGNVCCHVKSLDGAPFNDKSTSRWGPSLFRAILSQDCAEWRGGLCTNEMNFKVERGSIQSGWTVGLPSLLPRLASGDGPADQWDP